MASASTWGVGGAVALIGGIYVVDRIDVASNYVMTDATVRSIKVDCFIEAGKSKLVEKGTTRQAFVDCDRAPELARQFGYQSSDIHKRMTVSYIYESPVDKTWYRGQFVDKRPSSIPQEGEAVKVHAHKSTPAQSRWAYAAVN